ncbi:ester cyclase [Muriicola sp. Z0-33]|uniref:ester cyclase n=1 Tax=Muriicola sp. Z0-33 TaxID=2816957 RepID=UPI002238B04B|nr:ester cyclase [Muriicola sp. Z0-33]MCW5517006.1 ester cyclase [Muriicola sp. Z0-33]
MKTTYLAIVLLVALFISCKEWSGAKNEAIAEISHEELLRNTYDNFVEYAWNNSNMDSLTILMEENFVKYHNGIQIAENKSEMEANMNIYFKGFPDGRLSVDNVQVKGDNLFAQWVYMGTNTGMFGEFAPTGKKVKIHGYTHIEFNAVGKMIKEAVYFNELELLQQLGYTLNPPVLE